MFMNILSNAEEAIDCPQGTISLYTTTKEGFAQVTIIDSGSGISKDHMRRIGDPFFTTKDPGEGLGLGLYVVHTILEKHGGAWEVESTPGIGTHFTVRLPLV